jgi:hypothetical protein
MEVVRLRRIAIMVMFCIRADNILTDRRCVPTQQLERDLATRVNDLHDGRKKTE